MSGIFFKFLISTKHKHVIFYCNIMYKYIYIYIKRRRRHPRRPPDVQM